MEFFLPVSSTSRTTTPDGAPTRMPIFLSGSSANHSSIRSMVGSLELNSAHSHRTASTSA